MAKLFIMSRRDSLPGAAIIGVIGGADGPTAVFTATRPAPLPMLLIGLTVAAAIISGVVLLVRRK